MNSLSSQPVETQSRHAGLWDDSLDLSPLTPEALESVRAAIQNVAAAQFPPFKEMLDATDSLLIPQARASWLADDLRDVGWHLGDAAVFFGLLGRNHVHASRDRQFSTAYWSNICMSCKEISPPNRPTHFLGCTSPKCGTTTPRLYPPHKLGDKQYIQITHPQRSAFVTVDVDIPGTPGGSFNNLDPEVRNFLNVLTYRGCPPNLGGINPLTGKGQFIWYIDPVYNDGDPTKPNRPTKFLQSLHQDINELLGGDTSFSHGFMRNPFYCGTEETAYKWNAWHGTLYSMKQIRVEVRRLLDVVTPPITPMPTPPKTGRDLIEEVQARRQAAESYAELAKELSDLPVEDLEVNDPNYVQGVLIKYSPNRVVARNQTAFEHALKTATRMKKRGQRLSDAAIIDAFTRAYGIAATHAQDGRPFDLPGKKDLTKTAQRIRGYVTSNAHNNPTNNPTGTGKTATSHERKVLATFGRRGAQVSNQRRWTNPDSDLAKRSLEPLTKANQQRTARGKERQFSIAVYFQKQLAETGTFPTVSEAMEEFDVSRATVKRALKQAQMSLPRGRPKISDLNGSDRQR